MPKSFHTSMRMPELVEHPRWRGEEPCFKAEHWCIPADAGNVLGTLLVCGGCPGFGHTPTL